jgi:hypothetical protein
VKGLTVNTLNSEHVAKLLSQLHKEAEQADSAIVQETLAKPGSADSSIEQAAAQMIADERVDYRAVYSGFARNFLSVTHDYGRFL